MSAEFTARDIDQAFADGARRHPETNQDMQRATVLAIASIEDEPWVKWWDRNSDE